MNIKLAGENSLIIYFSDQVSPELIQRIAFYQQQIKQQFADLIIDMVPSYTSLWMSYRLDKTDHHAFATQIEQLLSETEFQPQQLNSDVVEIPVIYDFDMGLDLADVLDKTGLTINELIALHSEQNYLVYAIGFSPVFAYLGQLDARLQLPRLTTPRLQIPAGSVGIADDQTAVYPVESAGGWNIIGRSTIDLSLNNPDNLHRFKVGQRVRFVPVSQRVKSK
jgi:KipI family sensor histidine kinase inhibitor